ncbi:MAG: hypothetical protein ACFFDW_07685 [Candidatus Thorarchaeota archaeon]
MTVRGKHLQCDGKEVCISCSIYTWPPKLAKPKKYHHCEHCKKDILCDRGLSLKYAYFENGYVEKKAFCITCGNPMLEIIWPGIPTRLERELLKLE